MPRIKANETKMSNHKSKYHAEKQRLSYWQRTTIKIFWNFTNSLLAGTLIFLGALSNGQITKNTIALAVLLSLSAFVVQFKDFVEKETDEVNHD